MDPCVIIVLIASGIAAVTVLSLIWVIVLIAIDGRKARRGESWHKEKPVDKTRNPMF